MSAWVCPCCELPEGPHTRRRGNAPVCAYCQASLARKGQRWCRTHGRVDSVADGRCRECHNAKARARRQRPEVRERINARKARWQQANRERLRQYDRDYRARVGERRRAQLRAASAKRRADPERREQLNAATRMYYQRNRAARLAYGRTYKVRQKLKILRGWQ